MSTYPGTYKKFNTPDYEIQKRQNDSKITFKVYLAQNDHFVEIKGFQSLNFKYNYVREEYPIEGFLDYIFNNKETSFSLGVNFKLPFSLFIEYSDKTIFSILDIRVQSAKEIIDNRQNYASVLCLAKKMLPRTEGTLPLDLENK